MTFLSSSSLVFSVPWKLFLTKKYLNQKNIPQIILKERTAHLASYTFLQETLINIKTRHFHSSINHQELFFHWTRITSYFRPVNIAKFLRIAFLYTSRSHRLQMFIKIVNFKGKHLCLSPFLKKDLQRPATLFKKGFNTGFFLRGLQSF